MSSPSKAQPKHKSPGRDYRPVPSSGEPAGQQRRQMAVHVSGVGNDGSETDLHRGDGMLPTTYSSQHLMTSSDSESVAGGVPRMSRVSHIGQRVRSSRFGRSQWFTVTVLCFVNLINYMDRFTIAGVLTDIQEEFQIGDDEGGLLQTAFVLSYMVCAPIFGYLGDRYSRRLIMAIGVLIWSTTTLLGSYMTHFGWFITFRALVGIGEASYSTIAPTIISDMFVHDMRSKMLALFYFAIPVGSGMGYIVGSETAVLANNWRWALRVTPIMGVIAVVLLCATKDPVRGESEGAHNLAPTTYAEDIKDLVKNRSFMLSTGGFTCVAFVAGALSWWGPKFIHLGLRLQPGNENLALNDVSFKFGAITMVAGLVGVPLGSFLSQAMVKTVPTADPMLCAFGLILSAPLMTGAMLLVTRNTVGAYTMIFFGQVALNMNWAIVADILLYVVVPTRRSTAEAFQILISHALGDAGSPYFVGVLSETIKGRLRPMQATRTSEFYASGGFRSLSLTLSEAAVDITNTTAALLTPMLTDKTTVLKDTTLTQFEALQYALFSTCFVEVLGGVFFLLTAAFIITDKRRANQGTHPRVNIDEIS